MTLTTHPNPLSLLGVKLRTLRSPMLALTLTTLAMVAAPTAQASDGRIYELSTTPKPKKPASLVEFEGHEMSIDAAHELRASAGACTYATMSSPGPDLCPDSQEVSTWTQYAEVEMSQFGGEVLLSPGILAASASSEQQRDDCGSAAAAAALNATVSHVALATGSGMVAFSMIQGAHESEASDSDDVDFSTNCLTAAGSSTEHETLSEVITDIPFTLAAASSAQQAIAAAESSSSAINMSREPAVKASRRLSLRIIFRQRLDFGVVKQHQTKTAFACRRIPGSQIKRHEILVPLSADHDLLFKNRH